MSDLIDRASVLKAIDEYERLSAVSQTVRNMTSLREIVEKLPSAQPEKLTDKEQRIFLSAMGREEEVCKEVDDAWRASRK